MTKNFDAFGVNAWLADELYERYLHDPSSVDPAWQAIFSEGEKPAPPPRRTEERRPAPPVPGAEPLRGVAASIARNMEESLAIPTATSVRFVPAKLLEENRRLINAHVEAGKVSFTHLIGWAVVRALDLVPLMKVAFTSVDGKPHVLRRDEVGLGLAVDLERDDGSRVLLVPVVRDANRMSFRHFWMTYEDLVRKARDGKLKPDDFAGATATLTNPGTIGTALSVPRLMPGQGVIVGVGRIGAPSEFQAADPSVLSMLGVGKVIGITSTYDHRVIQGAVSGEFLAIVEQLLTGMHGFYDDVFESLDVPQHPMRWAADRGSLPSGPGTAEAAGLKQADVSALVNMYRVRGHLVADVDPLRSGERRTHPELELEFHGLSIWDLDREFEAEGLPGGPHMTLRKIVDTLRTAYCGTIGVEYMHIQEPDQKRWIQQQVEGPQPEPTRDDRMWILNRLNAAESFETFLHSQYVGHKRFSLEGAEVAIPMIDALLDEAASHGVEEIVMGMAHRGRLNVLANVVGKSMRWIFGTFEGDIDPETVQGSGDVTYHLGATGGYKTRDGSKITVTLASNPSHLEAVNPVVEGMARARQDRTDPERRKIVPLLLHGDAAFAGQGVVAETLTLSQLPGYTTGGTVHLVINNNIGFTTAPTAGRSGAYATDVAKMVQAPIFHVNADDPEACVRVMRLAFEFKRRFRKDVVVDLVCYRRYGHNEADDPSFTQPLMYAKIESHPSVRSLYVQRLVERGEIDEETVQRLIDQFRAMLRKDLEQTRASKPPRPKLPDAPVEAPVLPPIETGVSRDVLDRIVHTLVTWPGEFHPHPKLARQFARRNDALQNDDVDWGLAEALAFGSLVHEGVPVRLAGQDSRRGTFSQRHAVIVDHRTGEEWFPLQHVSASQAPFRVFDSPLSEYAAMGFEYGYSVVASDALVAWEAQFGDFVNGAQIVVDQFVVSGEDKWGQASGLVLLLPHGHDGQGPEHSSARLERFLQLAAEGDLVVAYPSTPAQYFHLLRRQARLAERKPLVVMTPKLLLRLPAARSAAAGFTQGHFLEVISEDGASANDVRTVLVCSGKVAYELEQRRAKEERDDVAVVRVEQLYPWPEDQLVKSLEQYPNAREVRWVQEEPENMGAWPFVHGRVHRMVRDRWSLSHVARPESGAPATGSKTMHTLEQEDVLARAFALS